MYTNEEIEIQKLKDKTEIAKRWDRLESEIAKSSNVETAKKLRLALENYYRDLYRDGDLIKWVVNLYDPIVGGFYYSNSARDNEGFLPDLESTYQATSWINTMGTPEVFGSFIDLYPEWMRKQIIKFAKERQDENGYFYHPQWTKEFTDSKPHRRGRDLNWACKILERFGDTPTYDTPNGVKGNGVLADGTPAPNYISCESKDVVAPREEFVDPRFKDKESFVKFLDDLASKYGFDDWYGIGSCIESLSTQIYMRDQKLCEMGADYSLCNIAAEWMTKHQNPKNGLWVNAEVDSYEGRRMGASALLKVSSAYSGLKKPVPRAELALKSVITLTMGELPISSVCCVLNTLYSINVLLINVREFGKESSEEKNRIETEIKKYVFEHAAEIIEITKKRILEFKKSDGSFSYTQRYSSPTSQGHPVAVPGSNEGDVNATCISTASIILHIFLLLDLDFIPVFTPADKMRFLNMIEEKNNTVKS